MAKQIKNPYDLEIGTVYKIDDLGFYVLDDIQKASSGAFIYLLTYTHTSGKSYKDYYSWHQYGDYSNLVKLVEAEQVLQVLYGYNKGSL